MNSSPGLTALNVIFLGEPIVSKVDAEMSDRLRSLIDDIISPALPFVATNDDPKRSSVVITLIGSALMGVLCLMVLVRSSSSEEMSITKS